MSCLVSYLVKRIGTSPYDPEYKVVVLSIDGLKNFVISKLTILYFVSDSYRLTLIYNVGWSLRLDCHSKNLVTLIVLMEDLSLHSHRHYN